MYRYVLHRLLFLIPSVLGVIFILFLVMSMTPGDPARILLGDAASQAQVDELNHQLGYDLPFLEKYVRYVYQVVVHQGIELRFEQVNNAGDGQQNHKRGDKQPGIKMPAPGQVVERGGWSAHQERLRKVIGL